MSTRRSSRPRQARGADTDNFSLDLRLSCEMDLPDVTSHSFATADYPSAVPAAPVGFLMAPKSPARTWFSVPEGA
jgi:hypothetical protein